MRTCRVCLCRIGPDNLPCPNGCKDLFDIIRENFRFKYIGGGYFRDDTIEKGKKAELRHGEQIIEEFCSELLKYP